MRPPPTKDETAASTSTSTAKPSSEKVTEKATDDSDDYEEMLMKALGNIRLRLHHTIGYQYTDEESPYRLWN